MNETKNLYIILFIAVMATLLIPVVCEDQKSFGFSGYQSNVNGKSARVDPQSGGFAAVLAPLAEVKKADIVLDISPNSSEYIAGAININYENFFGKDKRQKSVSEIAKILGDAGITQNESVLIYGECRPCGGGPSAATYVYWLMKYLGHDNVKLLDGGIDTWVSANLPTQNTPTVLPKKIYIPSIKAELLSNYDYVKSGNAQIIDARTVEEFEAASITWSANIPYEKVLDGKRLKDEAELKSIFSSLSKDRPVVIYTTTGVKASMIWLALDLLGYDARLYSWQDWMDHQSLNLSLKGVLAEPNPAKTGDIVKITVVFKLSNETLTSSQTKTSSDSIAENKTILRIKGCSTCGAEGFFLDAGGLHSGNNSGVIQLSSIGTGSSQTPKSSGLSNIKCTAIISSSDGTEVARRTLAPISDREFSGIWNANVAKGSYKVDIIASTPDITKIFRNMLRIDVSGSTSKYNNLGK